jgi:hypothetical protein
LCCICRESPKCILLLPCKHVCMCSACAEQCLVLPYSSGSGSGSSSGSGANVAAAARLKCCPVCRGHVLDFLRIFT